MLKIHIHKSSKSTINYYIGDKDEAKMFGYYTNDNNLAPSFLGKGAERLRIAGTPLTKEIFADLCNKINPNTKKSLALREKDGSRVAYDAVFSPSKTITIMGVVLNDIRITEAVHRANKKAMKRAEKLARTRIRKEGIVEDRTTGELTVATMLHLTSRAGDPQIHHHNVIFNHTYDESQNRYTALDPFEIYKASALLTEIYRSDLVRELHKIGYRTRTTKNGFEIEGVPEEVIQTFSKRHIEIDETAKADGKENDQKHRAEVAQNTRKAKKSVPLEELKKKWISEISPENYKILTKLKASANKPIKVAEKTPAEALQWAKKHLLERESAITRNQLLTSALKYSRGSFEIDDLETHLDSMIEQGDFISTKRNILTTQQAIDEEQKIVSLVNEGCGHFSPFNDTTQISQKLTEEQQGVVLSVLNSPDLVSSIRGVAGAGKTKTLTELVKHIEEKNGEAVMLAPSGTAREVLVEDGFETARTLQRFLTDSKAQKESKNRVIIVDEASMISLKQGIQLLEIAKEHNNRIILVGDTKQHSSVERPCLQLLENKSNLRTATIGTIFRQKDVPKYKKAVEHLSNGEAVKGFDTLDNLGWIKQIKGDISKGRGSQLANDFADVLAKGETALAVSPTWREANAITREIRAQLKERGIVKGEDHPMNILVPLHFTEAEREETSMITAGNVLIFNRKCEGFFHSEQVEVVSEAKDGLLWVRRSNGNFATIDTKKNAEAYQCYTRQEAGVAVGDRIFLRANGKTADNKSLLNGQIVKISKIAGSEITLSDGRVLPANYRTFGLGYTISTNASQGKTVQNIFIGIDALSACSATSLEGFYVAVSRGSKTCTIYTDKKTMLRKAIQHSSARQTALSVLEEKEKETLYEKQHPTERKPKPLSNAVQLALAQGVNHPRNSPSARHRADHKQFVEPADKSQPSEQTELQFGSTRDTDLRGRGFTNDQISRSAKSHDVTQLV